MVAESESGKCRLVIALTISSITQHSCNLIGSAGFRVEFKQSGLKEFQTLLFSVWSCELFGAGENLRVNPARVRRCTVYVRAFAHLRAVAVLANVLTSRVNVWS